jgi:DNA-binding SARP family transcriptional activator/tetratricopeptide (TPR) repeat protein
MTSSEEARRVPFEYRCLGPVSLHTADGRKLAFRTRKQMALFTLFVRRQGQPQPRDLLIDLLWSEDDLGRARHSLSQSTSLINKALGCEAITAPSKDELVLQEGLVRADVAEFERCAVQRRHRDARALWRGNLLEGIWIHRAPNFERWLEAERRRLLETMRRALHELLATCRSEGGWEEMRSVADALLDLDGLDEAGMLAQLVALTLLGDRTLALRRYATFEARLRDELGAEPGPEVRDWAKRQRGGGAGIVPAESAGFARVSEPATGPVAHPLYGRTAEFARLWQAWNAAREGHGGCVVLLGTAGIGKSALAAKLVDQVRVASGAACMARCFRTEKCVPFAPVSALVRQMAELPGFVALSDVWISELSRLAPELRSRFPNAPPALAADDSVRHRVCEATCRAGESISFEQPLLIVVDNVQDADETTLALLHYFGRQANAQRTLLLYVVRTEEPGRGLGEFAEQARAQGFAQLQRVGPLEDAHLQRIVSDVLGKRRLQAPVPILQSVARLARGNPLHATELALAIPASDGRPASDWLLSLADRARSPEESFEHTASVRLAALSAGARLVMSALAVAARPLAEHELLAVTTLAPAELASAVFKLEAAQLLRRDGLRLGFAHDSYAAVAGAALEDEERVGFHARLAAVLAESAARNAAARIEVALHLERAGIPGEARAHALAAADFAGFVGAANERAEALELVRRVSGTYDGEVAAALALCYLGLRDFERVDALCEEARRQPQQPEHLKGEFRYLEIAVDHHSGRASFTQVSGALAELLGPQGMGAFAHRSDAMTLLMRTADKTGDFRLVRATARAQRRSSAASTGGEASAHALFASAYVFAKYYWPERALPLLERARCRAEQEQNWELEHACRDGLGVVLKQLGRFAESVEQIRYSLALARRTLNPQAEATSLLNLAVSEIALGDFEIAAAHLDESAQIDSQYPRWYHRVYRHANQADLAFQNGNIDEAACGYDRALQQATEIAEWRIAVVGCAGLALCAKERHDSAGLARRCSQLRSILGGQLKSIGDRWQAEAALAWDTCINQQDPSLALRGLERALRELPRRDTDHWLRLELEATRVEEFTVGQRLPDRRRKLAELGRRYSAAKIVSEAEANPLPPRRESSAPACPRAQTPPAHPVAPPTVPSAGARPPLP